MAASNEREEFIARFCVDYAREVGNLSKRKKFTLYECLEAARALLRLARTHGNLAVAECNGPPEYQQQYRIPDQGRINAWAADLQRRQERCEKRIRDICAGFNLPVTLGGDPRGYTIRVKLPSGAYNTWGGSAEGYGIPS